MKNPYDLGEYHPTDEYLDLSLSPEDLPMLSK